MENEELEKIYMAGPLFSEAEVNQRLLEARLLEYENAEHGLKFEVFSPINAPVNDKSKLPTAEDIFVADESALMLSSVVFADLSGQDAGVMMELGMVIHEETINIYPYLSDIRLENSGDYDKQHVPFGYNQFIIGGLERYGHKVYFSFKEALDAYLEDFKPE